LAQISVPQNLIEGFRKCGVFPLNHYPIKVIEEDPQCGTSTGKETTHSNSTIAIPAPDHDLLDLSDETRKKIERRYEEGYDLPDPLYEKWLSYEHPDSIGSVFRGSISSLVPDAQILSPIPISDDQAEIPVNSNAVKDSSLLGQSASS